jgi:hypothetical protein
MNNQSNHRATRHQRPRGWSKTLLKWSIPFIPPCLRSLTVQSFQVLLQSLWFGIVAIIVSLCSISPLLQVKIITWCLCWYVSIIYFHVGAIYFMFSVLLSMLWNLGDRAEGELSAYSVFNENWTRLMGQVTAEQLIAEQFGGAAFAAVLPRVNGRNNNNRINDRLVHNVNEGNDANNEGGARNHRSSSVDNNNDNNDNNIGVRDEDWDEDVNLEPPTGGIRRRQGRNRRRHK